MGGWFIDVFIEYFVRVIVRAFRRCGSKRWAAVKGTVTSSGCAPPGLGCSVAEVCYTYRVDEDLFTGINEKPFLSGGGNYANRHETGREITVRVKPGSPEKSVVREDDQDGFCS